ncbi:MAG: 50S ribosomal protein L11 methyltransferase [Acidobacteriota bacterium]|jgi:methylase of polypeptide subunit release factors|nr:50S ribosomal protein L11 methyltransferase [Acidobacteriota bacterium]
MSDMGDTSDTIFVNTREYLRLDGKAERIRQRLAIEVTDHAYLPKVDNLDGDWVASVAVPAFKHIRAKSRKPVGAFCSIGTGSGLDVLAAIETLGARRVGLTDLDAGVVTAAAGNVQRNRLASHPLVIEAGHGDLFAPLKPFGAHYDLIYENLPNIPIGNTKSVAADRNSGAHVAPRQEKIPKVIKRQLLDLHYLLLVQAKDFLLPGGSVLSMLGARIPLEVYLHLGELAGYESNILSYSWKVQAEPEEVIPGHVRTEKRGFGPFHFYRADTLRKTFRRVTVASSGKKAFDIEKSLVAERLSPEAALAAWKSGETIGHTVAVLQSTPHQ